jgi:hypothetical protein
LDYAYGNKAEIVPLTGTTFRCQGVRCALLGVKDSHDPKVRERAEAFTREWFRSVGNIFCVANTSNPLTNREGAAVVWLRVIDTSLSCLNEELVRAGLVEIDDSSWNDYGFTVTTRESEREEDWQGILRRAKESPEDAKLPRRFEWPIK